MSQPQNEKRVPHASSGLKREAACGQNSRKKGNTLFSAQKRILSGGLVVVAGIAAAWIVSAVPQSARSIVGSPAGMCADSATNLAILRDIRERLSASSDSAELQRLTQEFFHIQTHTQQDITRAKGAGQLEKEKSRLLGRIAALQQADASGQYAMELENLAEQTRSAQTTQDLASVDERVLFFTLLIDSGLQGGSGGVVGTGPATSPQGGDGIPDNWKVVAQDELGWLTETIIQDGAYDSEKRFSIVRLADGRRAVQHKVNVGDLIWPPGWDSPPFEVDVRAKGFALRYWAYHEGYYGHGGKFISLMGGRGVAGSKYQKPANATFGSDGWGHVTMHPSTDSSNPATAKNHYSGYAYAYNRCALGGTFNPSTGTCYAKEYRNDRTPWPLKKWIPVEIVTIMNSPGKADGEGYIRVDGKEVAHITGVQWYGPREPEWKTVWMRWRIMNGGNPDQMPQQQAFVEYYRDFTIFELH